MKHNNSGICLAFDHGGARIGVAVGQLLTASARPLTTIKARQGEPDWLNIDKLMQEWQPAAVVIGLPLHADGSASNSSKAARAFASSLTTRYGIAVHLHDERLSSKDAEQRFAEARRSGQVRAGKAAQMDAMAAAIILESWMQDKG
jgi:putative Holliday junction resolvase